MWEGGRAWGQQCVEVLERLEQRVEDGGVAAEADMHAVNNRAVPEQVNQMTGNGHAQWGEAHVCLLL